MCLDCSRISSKKHKVNVKTVNNFGCSNIIPILFLLYHSSHSLRGEKAKKQ